MKNFFKAIGNFFKKVWLFIWKYLKVIWNYIKENAWIQPIAIVALVFALIFGMQGIIKGVENIKESIQSEKKSEKDAFIKLSMGEVREKLDNNEDFALFIGSRKCDFCNAFKPIINKYIKSKEGNMIYYIDIADTSDSTLDRKYLREWAQMLHEIPTRTEMFNGEDLSTPTVIVIEDGQFKDAKAGAQALNGGIDYLNFVKFVEGGYIDKIEE